MRLQPIPLPFSLRERQFHGSLMHSPKQPHATHAPLVGSLAFAVADPPLDRMDRLCCAVPFSLVGEEFDSHRPLDTASRPHGKMRCPACAQSGERWAAASGEDRPTQKWLPLRK